MEIWYKIFFIIFWKIFFSYFFYFPWFFKLRKFDIPTSVDDIEAVACDDINQLIYIAEEGKHKITAFNFPQATNETIVTLAYNYSFTIDTELDDPQSGIEGLTVDPIHNVLYAANEKNEKMLFKLNNMGEVLMISYPDFSDDLSGLCYDPSFDHLWVVSDRSERFFFFILWFFYFLFFYFWTKPPINFFYFFIHFWCITCEIWFYFLFIAFWAHFFLKLFSSLFRGFLIIWTSSLI